MTDDEEYPTTMDCYRCNNCGQIASSNHICSCIDERWQPKNDYSSAEWPFRGGHECDPSEVTEWIDENFIIASKEWKGPRCLHYQEPHPLIDEGIMEKIEGCTIGHHQPGHPSCQKCPYRKGD